MGGQIMSITDVLTQLNMIDPICSAIAQDLNAIEQAYQAGQLNTEQRQELLQEVRDIRAAQECAGNEIAFRYIVEACNIMISVA